MVGIPSANAEESSNAVRVNARWWSVTDSTGTRWEGRSGFTGPANRSEGLKGRDVAGTEEDVLYQANLFGATGYSTPLPNGTYQVRLLMAEDYHTAPGRRVFDVEAEGALELQKVDIVGAVGRHAAYDRIFDVAVADGALDLVFRAHQDKSLISAIEIVPVAPAAETSPVETPVIDETPPQEPVAPAMSMSPDVGGGGLRPLITENLITSSAGGGDSRSEVFWGTQDQGRIRLPRHATVTAEFDIRHDLHDPLTGASPSSRTWHTIFQLHGPTKSNTWPGPPFTIAWQNGTYRIGGGGSVPDSQGVQSFRGSWFQPYLTAPNNVWRKIKVTAYLDGPGAGWVSVWVDGKPYLQKWKPVAGTMYTESGAYSHKEINIKSGLYTGTDSPSWFRSVQQRNIRVTWVADGASGEAALR